MKAHARAYAIRRSQPKDADRVVEVWRAAVDATHDFLSRQDRAAIDVEARAYLASASLWVTVDECDKAIAFMALGEGELETLFVDPAYHGRGIGRALVDWAAALQPLLDVEVNAQNRQALAFYRRRGFIERGVSETDGQGRAYPLVRMRLDATGDILIRHASLADTLFLPEIERSAAESFRATRHAWVADDDGAEPAAYLPLVAAHTLWVAERSDAVIGFAAATVERDALHVLELAVHGRHQRRGVGRRLMRAAITQAQIRNLASITLTTFRDIPFNAPFYASLGFEILEVPPPRLQAILTAERARGMRDRCAMRLRIASRPVSTARPILSAAETHRA
jgi:putative acetyltransferase